MKYPDCISQHLWLFPDPGWSHSHIREVSLVRRRFSPCCRDAIVSCEWRERRGSLALTMLVASVKNNRWKDQSLLAKS